MVYNQNIHHRRSVRLVGYDYSQSGLYFVTICVKGRECLLGDVVDGVMVLNDYGRVVENAWFDLSNHISNIYLHEFCIMPNHIHGIIEIVDNSSSIPLSEIVRQFKTFSARRINLLRGIQNNGIWQRNYYEHIIRSIDSYIIYCRALNPPYNINPSPNNILFIQILSHYNHYNY
ncbi:MAG: transposase [Bacteroidales bacterium]